MVKRLWVSKPKKPTLDSVASNCHGQNLPGLSGSKGKHWQCHTRPVQMGVFPRAQELGPRVAWAKSPQGSRGLPESHVSNSGTSCSSTPKAAGGASLRDCSMRLPQTGGNRVLQTSLESLQIGLSKGWDFCATSHKREPWSEGHCPPYFSALTFRVILRQDKLRAKKRALSLHIVCVGACELRMCVCRRSKRDVKICCRDEGLRGVLFFLPLFLSFLMEYKATVVFFLPRRCK